MTSLDRNLGNDRALDNLHAILKSGEGIAFVGSGASAGLYPLWYELIDRLAMESVARRRATNEQRNEWSGFASKKPQIVAEIIRETLGDDQYADTLRRIFRPKMGPDGKKYTPIHDALLRMPFRGYVTTNYDPGLIEARHALRPDVTDTGYTTWKDTVELGKWYRGEVFSEHACPILFAHGVYERPDTIVLGRKEYGEAYRPGGFSRLFDDLWGRERMVFVGFGFSDPWLDYITSRVLIDISASPERTRHVAVIGLRDSDDGSEEARRLLRHQYNAEVYFYPITKNRNGDEDHGRLRQDLEGLAQSFTATQPTSTAVKPRVSPLRPRCALSRGFPQIDEKNYVEHAGTLDRLNRWADDRNVKMIAVTGLGGSGKTSLVGHWLTRHHSCEHPRPNTGLFFWSFYVNREVSLFLKALSEYATRPEFVRQSDYDISPVEIARNTLEKNKLIVILDGLEVLQEGPGDVLDYGRLQDIRLREFLKEACTFEHQCLVVLTSRFPFVDLTSYLGKALRALDIEPLSPEEGADLLRRQGVEGHSEDRAKLSRQVRGHPLLLRSLARTILAEGHHDPTRLDSAFLAKLDGDSVEQKLRHILTTYEKHLSPHGAALMGIVALFRAAVEESLIRSVATQASCLKGLFSHFGEDVLHAELVALCEEDLMLRNDCGSLGFLYSCHPLVRDYYQRVLLTRYETVASEVASILLKQPGEKLRTGAARLEPIITAVKLLIDTGDITRADRVFIEQLRDGNEFRDLPAPADGLWCVRNFVRDESHRTDCERVLGADRFAFLLVTAGLFAMLAGEPKLAAEYYRDAATVTRSRTILWRVLQNRAILLAHLGSPEEADDLAKRALSLAVEDGNEDEIRSSLVCLAYVLAVRGLVELACQKLEEANRIRSSADSADNLTHTDGVFQARVLLWLGETGRARELTRRNLDLCKDTNDNANVSRCHFILGAIALAEKQLATSRRHLRFAETIMRQTHQFLELPLVLAARADLHRRAREWDDAFCCVTDALDLSASRGWGIAHTDSLLMRGWITLDCIGHNGARNRHFDAWAKHRKINRSLNMYGDRGWATKDPSIGWEVMRADDDAYNARRLARAYGYFRAEQDALLLLHETCFALGESADGL